MQVGGRSNGKGLLGREQKDGATICFEVCIEKYSFETWDVKICQGIKINIADSWKSFYSKTILNI